MYVDTGSACATEDVARRMGTLNGNVLALLDRSEYRRCENGDDLQDIFRLRYKAYRLNEVVPDSRDHIICDELDTVPNAHNFGVYVDDVLVSTLRIHHVTLETPWSASTKAFGDIVCPMLEQGHTFVCMSRFASDPEWSRALPHLPYVTLRLAGIACLYFNVPYGLSTVREDHAGFYRRIYNSERLGEPRPYPGFIKKVVLFRTDAHTRQEAFYARFPFFRSTPAEQRLLFGVRRRGEPAPLTIRPTIGLVQAA